MMDLIVLGTVPGTNILLTFDSVLNICLGVLLVVLFRAYLKSRTQPVALATATHAKTAKKTRATRTKKQRPKLTYATRLRSLWGSLSESFPQANEQSLRGIHVPVAAPAGNLYGKLSAVISKTDAKVSATSTTIQASIRSFVEKIASYARTYRTIAVAASKRSGIAVIKAAWALLYATITWVDSWFTTDNAVKLARGTRTAYAKLLSQTEKKLSTPINKLLERL